MRWYKLPDRVAVLPIELAQVHMVAKSARGGPRVTHRTHTNSGAQIEKLHHNYLAPAKPSITRL